MTNPLLFDWDEPVSNTDRDTMLARIAEQIKRRGLQTPAIWFLEIHRPLFPLGGQLAIGLSPFLALFFSGGAFDLRKYTKLMSDPQNVGILIRLIDSDAPAGGEAARAQ
jgi:hypothetical protein